MPFYIVTARYDGDDEDSIYIYEVDSSTHAIDKATDELIERIKDDDKDAEPSPDNVYINGVIECHTQPRIIYFQGL